MECNKEEALRAFEIAERKLCEKDYDGAKQFASKARDLYPALDGLKQVLTIIDVYISAASSNEESDWYGILGVDPLADYETLKKQYKKLARLIHPDKNKSNGAEGAFILVSDAWCLLADHSKRTSYDQRRKSKEDEQKAARRDSYDERRKSKEDEQKAARRDASSDPLRWFDGLNLRTTSDGAKDPFREWFAAKEAEKANSSAEAERLFKKRANANSTCEAERLFKFKKPVMTTGNANYSTSQSERMERANANSTCEAQRLFGNWMERANAKCTSEAERLFMGRYVI